MDMIMTPVVPKRFPWFDYSRYSFSLGVKRDDRIWFSGQTASEFDPDTKHMVVRGSMADQATTAYTKVEALLEAEGLDATAVSHIVENVTVDGLPVYPDAAAVREAFFGGHQPAVSTVVVRRLLRPAALIEIEVTVAGAPGTPPHSGRPDNIVHLPTLLPVDASGNMVAPGDLHGQAQRVYERAAEALASLGLGTEAIVKTLDITTPTALGHHDAVNRVRRELLGPVYPAATSVVMPRLTHPDALIALEVTASRDTPAAANPGWARYDGLTHNPAVRAGDTLFCSGLTALDPQTGAPAHDGDVVAQADSIYSNLADLLTASGAGPQHVVRTLEFVTPEGLNGYRNVAGVRQRLLRAPYPASTGLVCEHLHGRGSLLEVDATAVGPSEGTPTTGDIQ